MAPPLASLSGKNLIFLLYCSEPLVAVMSKRIFRALIFALMLYCTAYVYLSIADPGVPVYDNIDALRAWTIDLDAENDAPGPEVANFIPLFGQNRCVLNRSLWVPSGGTNLTLMGPNVAVSGISLTTVWEPLSGGRGSHNMVAVVEGRSPQTGTWHALPNLDSVCNMRLTALWGNGTVCWHAAASVEADWIWWVRLLGSSFFSALGFAVTLSLALLGHQRLARWALLAAFWLNALCMLVAAAGSFAESSVLQTQLPQAVCSVKAFGDLTYAVPFSVLAGGMSMVKRHPVAILATFVAVHVAGSSVRHFVVTPLKQVTEDTVAVILDFILGPQLIAFLVMLALVISRKRAMWVAHKLVHNDKVCYERIWADLVSRPGVKETLTELAKLLADFRPRRGKTVHQQRKQWYTASKPAFLPTQSTNVRSQLTVEKMIPVHSLDQLFLQAKCLLPIAQRKVRMLAVSCGGGGCARPASTPPADDWEQEFVMGSSGLVYRKASSMMSDKIMWGSVKSVNRAIEKVMRAYKQVHSELTLLDKPLALSLII